MQLGYWEARELALEILQEQKKAKRMKKWCEQHNISYQSVVLLRRADLNYISEDDVTGVVMLPNVVKEILVTKYQSVTSRRDYIYTIDEGKNKGTKKKA